MTEKERESVQIEREDIDDFLRFTSHTYSKLITTTTHTHTL